MLPDVIAGGSPTEMPLDIPPTLAEMNGRGQRIATAYYERGILDGIEMGRRLAEEEMAALWRQAHAVVQHAARQPTYEQLATLRQEPHRAERQRQLLRARGVAA